MSIGFVLDTEEGNKIHRTGPKTASFTTSAAEGTVGTRGPYPYSAYTGQHGVATTSRHREMPPTLSQLSPPRADTDQETRKADTYGGTPALTWGAAGNPMGASRAAVFSLEWVGSSSTQNLCQEAQPLPDNERTPYDCEEQMAIMFLRIVLDLKWGSDGGVLAKFHELFPPGQLRRSPATVRGKGAQPNSFRAIKAAYSMRSEDGMTSKYYRARENFGLWKVRRCEKVQVNHSDEEKSVVLARLDEYQYRHIRERLLALRDDCLDQQALNDARL